MRTKLHLGRSPVGETLGFRQVHVGIHRIELLAELLRRVGRSESIKAQVQASRPVVIAELVVPRRVARKRPSTTGAVAFVDVHFG